MYERADPTQREEDSVVLADVAGEAWSDFFTKAKEGVASVGNAMSNFGEFLATNINMADCCNNV